jgi:nucleoside-diphosphate-sugar epimerase
MNHRIFLAGASGAIGRRLAPLLVDADYEVFGTTAVKLSDSQIAALDQITAPPSLYPNWFNTNMVDDKHKEIFGTNRAERF